MRTTIYLDEDGKKAYETAEMPKGVTFGKIMKWIALAIVTPEKELYKIRDASPEGRAVANYLRGKIEKLIR